MFPFFNNSTFVMNPSYVADFMLIKLPPELASLISQEHADLRLDNPTEASLLLHEWIHYMQNISTISGIYAFASMIHLWAHFRSTIDTSGESVASQKLNDNANNAVMRTHSYRATARQQRVNGGPLSEERADFSVVSATTRETPLAACLPGEDEEKATLVECGIQVGSSEEIVVAEVGTLEIMEGLAWMIESRYLYTYKQFSKIPKIAPYQLLLKLCRRIVPDINDNDAIACGIAALQDRDPPAGLWRILHGVKAVNSASRRSTVAHLTSHHLTQSWNLIETLLRQTDDHFPNDEAMGNAVKHITSLMRSSMVRRRDNPLFELDTLDRLEQINETTRATALRDIIRELSCCRILSTAGGKPDTIGRDQILSYGHRGTNAEEFDFGHQKLHAALHFTSLHLKDDGFSETSSVDVSDKRRECPFYTACTHELRHHMPNLCAHHPWESIKIKTDPRVACWYRAGVRATRPPHDDPMT